MMYGIYPFVGKTSETLAVAISKGRIKALSEEIQEGYSEGLRKVLSLLLSQACFVIF
jgi:flagellar biosynthesis/type III secretory pathway protein FliH